MKPLLSILFVVLAYSGPAFGGQCPRRFAALHPDAPKPNFQPLTFEETPIEAAQNSVAVRAPEIMEELLKVRQALDLNRELAEHGDRSTREALEWLKNAQNEQAQHLRELADEFDRKYPHEYVAANLLRRLATKIVLGPHEQTNLEHKLNQRSQDGRPVGYRPVSAHDPGTETVLGTAAASARGPLGELIAGLMAEDLVMVGLQVSTVPGAREAIFSAQIDSDRAQSIYDSEMDLVFKKGAAWGEVKTYPYLTLEAMLRGKPSGKKTILQQAQEHADLGKIFHKEIHEFFVNGIAPDAAREFEKLGIIVHGVANTPPN